MSSPAVSVIIPAYNRRETLPKALDSVLSQTWSDWEIVLVDDGSTDGTAELARHYRRRLHDRLLYIRQENQGASHARNRGIDAARGRYLAFLDSDDEFLPRKLERQMALFKLRPDLGLVYCDYGFVDVDGLRHDSAFDAPHSLARSVPGEPIAPHLYLCTQDLFDVLIRGYFICTNSGMIRRDVLGSTIRFREDLTFGEEWLFYLEVARACPAGFVDEPLAVYHHHRGSLARSDKARNAGEYLSLLRAMRWTFKGLTPTQRLVLSNHLAVLCRQLGHAAIRDGIYREAFARFTESWRHAPRIATLWEALESAVRWAYAPLAVSRSDGVRPSRREAIAKLPSNVPSRRVRETSSDAYRTMAPHVPRPPEQRT